MINPDCHYCGKPLENMNAAGYFTTGWECKNCGATYLEDRASMEIVSGPNDEWKMGEVQ